MAITVSDIQGKDFGIQASGYAIEEVDDFLDEIAEQMRVLVRENLEMKQTIASLQTSLQAARQAQVEAEAKAPDYNEKGYFQNLQNAMRESLIGAQRIADETLGEAEQNAQKTVAEAQAKADQISQTAKTKAETLVAEAQAEAERITTEAKTQVESLQARFDAIKTAATSYKADFTKLLEQQAAALKETNGLF